jgi:hypothetical protein
MHLCILSGIMKKIPAAITVRNHLLAILLAGLLTTPLTLISPSEADSAFWLGLSKMRLAVVAFQIAGLLLVAVLLCSGWRSGFSSSFFKRFGQIFQQSRPPRGLAPYTSGAGCVQQHRFYKFFHSHSPGAGGSVCLAGLFALDLLPPLPPSRETPAVFHPCGSSPSSLRGRD